MWVWIVLAFVVVALDVFYSKREREKLMSAITDYIASNVTPVLTSIKAEVAAVQAKVAAAGQLSDADKAALDGVVSTLQGVNAQLAAIAPPPPPSPPAAG